MSQRQNVDISKPYSHEPDRFTFAEMNKLELNYKVQPPSYISKKNSTFPNLDWSKVLADPRPGIMKEVTNLFHLSSNVLNDLHHPTGWIITTRSVKMNIKNKNRIDLHDQVNNKVL